MREGDTIAERFFLRREAGRGGMGVVYRADDKVSGGAIALKLLQGRDAVDAARFQREATLLRELAHPHVVGYVDHGVTDDGDLFLAMEWLEGRTLSDRIAEGPLAADEALSVMRGAAAGLGAAHARGVIHRDVKPANLFLVDGDPTRLKVLDFGLARGVGAGHTLTQTGTVMGTPFYMAPEQASASALVDARADVYALGAVLYHALAGRPPFRSESLMAVLAAILLEDPVDVRERARAPMPEPLAALCMELLQKSRDARPADGRALLARLERLERTVDRPSASPPALTDREQRVQCLVLAEGAVGGPRPARLDLAATLPPGADDEAGRLRAAVEARGGAIEVLADGSIVARAAPDGTPTDQAVRAAGCALAMREVAPHIPLAVVAGRGQLGGPVPVGEVIERGLALLAGDAGSRTLRGGALGGPPPPPGPLPIRLDATMAGLVEDRFVVERGAGGAELGPERASPTTSRRLRGAPSPCVGRRRELGTLTAIYDECAEEPVARAVVITAAAGLGKTRLLHELLDALEDHEEAPRVWRAGGDPVAAGSPFGLLGQLLRAFASIAEGEPLPARRDKLLAAVGARVQGEPGRVLAARLGELCRVPFEATASMPPDDPRLRGDAMRDAWLSLLDAELARGPLVIALDDLQWGDRPSLAYLDDALRTLEDRPLCVIAAGRPEIDERLEGLWAERDALSMRLARLRPRAAERLVRHAFEGIDGDLARALVERADGNPFFLEELIRAVAEGGPRTELPTTVLGMVEARLGELEGPTRRVLRAASVFGRLFWRGGVEALLGGDARAPDVDEHLSVLRRRELVARQDPSRFEGEPQLAFRNELTREAAYATLTDDDRALGHRLAARWLEAAGERDAVRLAEHHARGGDDAAAAGWLAVGAAQALEGDDLEACVARGARALDAIDPAQAGELHVTLADAHRWRGAYPDAMRHAAQAAEALPEGTRPWFRALGVLFAAAGRLGRHDEAERWRGRAMEAVAAAGADAAQVVALCRAATLALARGEAGRYEATMTRAEGLAGAGAARDPLARAWIRTLRASEALRAGDVGAFVDGTEEAAASYEAAGDLRDACNQRVRLGNAYVGLGDPARAEGELRRALASASRMGLSLVEGYALQNLGHALLRQGRAQEARDALARAVERGQRLGDAILEAGSLLYLAESREATQAEAAIRDAARAVALLDDAPGFQVVARAFLARATLAAGDVHEACALAEACRRELDGHALEEGEALVHLVHAEALLAAGAPDRARAAARDAVDRLDARAARISDLGWRDAFLHRVPTHARLRALAA